MTDSQIPSKAERASNIIPTLRYVWLTLAHKWFVLLAGLRTGAPLWRLLIHDLSKLTPAEASYYGRQFFGDKSDPAGFARAWLHHQNVNPHHWEYWIPRTGHTLGGHDRNNRYVIQSHGDGYPMWITDTLTGKRVSAEVDDDFGGPNWKELTAERDTLNRASPPPLPMPEWAVREMVADWMGAGRAYQGKWDDLSDWVWLRENRPKMRLHSDTSAIIDMVLCELTHRCESAGESGVVA